MAKRKTKRKSNTRAKKRASNTDLAVVGLIILSVLLCVLIYGKSGIIGIKLNEILGGMMGIIKYILPIGTFLIGIKIALNDDEYLTSKLTQYAVLLMMVAKVTGLEPGTIDWSIKDAHIYVNQIEGIKEQLNRYETKGSLPAPKLWLNPDIQDFYAFDPKNDVKLIGYEHMGKISFPLAQ